MCSHEPPCPLAHAFDHDAARVVAACHEQGWVLLCNGVVRFDDGGELLPDGRVIDAREHRRVRGYSPTTRGAQSCELSLQKPRVSSVSMS
jgi:hypothetical protein